MHCAVRCTARCSSSAPLAALRAAELAHGTAKLDLDIADNRILGVASELHEAGLQTIFISKDINARVKCDALDIPAEDFEHDRVDADWLHTGWIQMVVPGALIDTLYDGHYKSREKLAWEFAKILNQEARELEAAGVDIIQFDEPAFNVFFDEVNDWGVATLERAIEGLKCETAVHICYGYGIQANTDWKKTLGSEWRQYEEAFPKLQKSTIDMISLECHNSHVPMDLIELVRGKKVMVGAIDVASNTIETPEEVANTLRKALEFVDADKLYPCTNCGMAPLSREVARGKLQALSAGAAIVRGEL